MDARVPDVAGARRGCVVTAYGKRGGTSVNAGRKATTYVATLPDGTIVRTCSYAIDADSAWIGAYEHAGQWHASGITATAAEIVARPAFRGQSQTPVVATREVTR